MRQNWSVSSGRYAASCDNGHCALRGNEATSKLEGNIFATLDFALGPGRAGAQVGRYRADMLFPLSRRAGLVLEYDGAYWHSGEEERDERKAALLEDYGFFVVRIRESPLGRLREWDLTVPARADAALITRLTALHLFHLAEQMWFEKPDGHPYYNEWDGPLGSLLRSDSRRLDRADVDCLNCWKIARRLLDGRLLTTERWEAQRKARLLEARQRRRAAASNAADQHASA
ncbi:DUF559 domain-containing protein [Catellatospora bangladeshensis]|uniref:DUF559 domain-containing protein n=1 Tax=Catellatospora bangladeshensis TaxID=310355 RepID=A0A8J3JVM4_9ACTN|nr:DUF559 domain-containing protein [Catellatospora bangladeshensis]GIF85878.1 hypothetical protein Cba03nite_72270 [Catellatospora bangladeshensis]